MLLTPESELDVSGDTMASLQGALNVALTNTHCIAPAFVLHDVANGGMRGNAAADSSDGCALSCRFDCRRFDVDGDKVPTACLAPRGMATLFLSKILTDVDTSTKIGVREARAYLEGRMGTRSSMTLHRGSR